MSAPIDDRVNDDLSDVSEPDSPKAPSSGHGRPRHRGVVVLVAVALLAAALAVAVTLWLTASGRASGPPTTAVVPDVVGMSVETADSVLRSAGVETVYSRGAMKIAASRTATVSSQQPPAGTVVQRAGSGVTVRAETAIATHLNHIEVDYDAPMADAYDGTFKMVTKRLWAGQPRYTVENFCTQAPMIARLAGRYTQANDGQQACQDAFELYDFTRAAYGMSAGN